MTREAALKAWATRRKRDALIADAPRILGGRAITSQKGLPLADNNIVSELAVYHYQGLTPKGGRSDKVWGGAVVRRNDPKISILSNYRFVAFWGRRGTAPQVKAYPWTTSDDAYESWRIGCRRQIMEGYQQVDWRDRRYGVASVVAELGEMNDERLSRASRTDPTPPPEPRVASKQARKPVPAPAPPADEFEPTLPAMRQRRDKKIL